ncbi:MAG: hypothetical protein HY399_06265 [Elusimicrobia bacterium]|nr:hypothetical protein [Elusimicrobiota bacterium]
MKNAICLLIFTGQILALFPYGSAQKSSDSASVDPLKPIPKNTLPKVRVPNPTGSDSLRMLTQRNVGQIKFQKPPDSANPSGNITAPKSKKGKKYKKTSESPPEKIPQMALPALGGSNGISGDMIETDENRMAIGDASKKGGSGGNFEKSEFNTRKPLFQSQDRLIPKLDPPASAPSKIKHNTKKRKK